MKVAQSLQHDDGLASGLVAYPYEARALGAPFKVFLMNGVTVTREQGSGKEITHVTDLPGLISAVVQARVLHSRKLSGPELKYIRSALCKRSTSIATALDLSPEHYSRCETGHKLMSASTEKVFRMYAYLWSIARDKKLDDADIGTGIAKTPEAAEKTVSAFFSVFTTMKIDPVFSPDDELAFAFSRGNSSCGERRTPAGCEEGEWETGMAA